MDGLVKLVADQNVREMNYPKFKSGDTVTVHYKIKEGAKERIQQFLHDSDSLRPTIRSI